MILNEQKTLSSRKVYMIGRSLIIMIKFIISQPNDGLVRTF